ncbi:diamine acetyltransferase 2 isoform X2 [Aplysia californica]|uniref:Diamine acetyltransferase 2 isoform X2 n=1 Tax=Aplysia californica TaxID=6500 RepID=A0ABM0K6E4_APLCA|nr:diamine acetyltransferase 2 isoform X2 [Aplysia californica]
MAQSNVLIRPAKPEDCDEIMRLIVELAEFEKMADQVHITTDTLRKDMFAEKPLCSSIVAELAGSEPRQLIGYSLFYPIYSTWDGVSMYLEDLYVTPSQRGQGLGKKIWQHVTKAALDLNCQRLHLAVLNWNTFAKDFYLRCGLIDLTETEDWHLMRMRRKEMENFVKDLKD